ncbi:hypothetical protein GJ496_006486 [Pomphorhynchus laevis]|nr:hypothetical protein GJ496_006486 [Pomphorhynchus laevis]
MQQAVKTNGISKPQGKKRKSEDTSIGQVDESDDDENEDQDDDDSDLASDDSDAEKEDGSEEDSNEDDDSSIEEQCSKQVPQSLNNSMSKMKGSKAACITNKKSPEATVDTNTSTLRKKGKKVTVEAVEPTSKKPLEDEDEDEDDDDEDVSDEDDDLSSDEDESEGESEADDGADESDEEDQTPVVKQKLTAKTEQSKPPKSILKKGKSSESSSSTTLQSNKKADKAASTLNKISKTKENASDNKKRSLSESNTDNDNNETSKNDKKKSKIKYGDDNLPADEKLFLKKVDAKDPKNTDLFPNAVVVRYLPITYTEKQFREFAPDADLFGYLGFKKNMVSVIINFSSNSAANAFIQRIDKKQIVPNTDEIVHAVKFFCQTVPKVHQNIDPLRIFVGNIAVESSKASLDSIFPENKSVTLIRKAKGPGYNLAFAFIEFNDPEPVKKYIAMSQKISLDGKVLNIRAAFHRDAQVTPQQQCNDTELDLKALYVNNLPSDVTSEQLNNLFSTAQKVVLSASNINKKWPAKSRFAFIYFNSAEDCAESLKANVLATLGNRQLGVSFKTTKGSNSMKDIDSTSITVNSPQDTNVAKKRKLAVEEASPAKKHTKKMVEKKIEKAEEIEDNYEDDGESEDDDDLSGDDDEENDSEDEDEDSAEDDDSDDQ